MLDGTKPQPPGFPCSNSLRRLTLPTETKPQTQPTVTTELERLHRRKLLWRREPERAAAGGKWREDQPAPPASRPVPVSSLSPTVVRVIFHNGDFLPLSDVAADARTVTGNHKLLGPVTLDLAADAGADSGAVSAALRQGHEAIAAPQCSGRRNRAGALPRLPGGQCRGLNLNRRVRALQEMPCVRRRVE